MTILKKIALATAASALLSSAALAQTAADLVREFYETVDDKSKGAAAISDYFAEGYVDHDRSPVAPAEVPDRLVALGLFAELEKGFPDAVHSIDILENIGEDRAVVYWTFTGTNTGEFFGAPASGNKVEINGVDIFRVENGKFVEQWHVEELATLFQQIAPAQ